MKTFVRDFVIGVVILIAICAATVPPLPHLDMIFSRPFGGLMFIARLSSLHPLVQFVAVSMVSIGVFARRLGLAVAAAPVLILSAWWIWT